MKHLRLRVTHKTFPAPSLSLLYESFFKCFFQSVCSIEAALLLESALADYQHILAARTGAVHGVALERTANAPHAGGKFYGWRLSPPAFGAFAESSTVAV